MTTADMLIVFGPLIAFAFAAALTFGVFSYGCFRGYW